MSATEIQPKSSQIEAKSKSKSSQIEIETETEINIKSKSNQNRSQIQIKIEILGNPMELLYEILGKSYRSPREILQKS